MPTLPWASQLSNNSNSQGDLALFGLVAPAVWVVELGFEPFKRPRPVVFFIYFSTKRRAYKF